MGILRGLSLDEMEEGMFVQISGTATAPKLQTTKTGKQVTNFSVAFAKDGDETKYMRVAAWGKLAIHAARIEKGDIVKVGGTLKKDTYFSKENNEDVFCIGFAEYVTVQDLEENSNSGFDDGDLMDLPD